MLRQRTVFVLGAAFSREMGFPLGGPLKTKIADTLNPRMRTDEVTFALTDGGRKQVEAEIRRLLESLPAHPSIDHLIQFHQSDPALVDAARIGIAATIMDAEAASALGRRQSTGDEAPLNWDNSYADIFRLVIQGYTRDRIAEAFDRVAFINFNYDRSLAQYFLRALTDNLGFAESQAHALVDSLVVRHPYGSLGPIVGTDPALLKFGTASGKAPLRPIAGRIKTFSEGIDSQAGQEIKALIASARRLIFLGCHNHPQNMALLAPKQIMAVKRIYGTVYGEPPADPARTWGMAEFLKPACLAFQGVIAAWQADASNNSRFLSDSYFRIDVATCRQLIARYGSEWTESSSTQYDDEAVS